MYGTSAGAQGPDPNRVLVHLLGGSKPVPMRAAGSATATVSAVDRKTRPMTRTPRSIIGAELK